jgi:hypothetical protein
MEAPPTNSLKKGAVRLTDPLPCLETTKKTTVVYMERRVEHVSTIIKILLKSVISTRSVQWGYKKNNTSTVTLRVLGGDDKRSLKSETVKYGRESQGTRTRERLRWQGPAAIISEMAASHTIVG